VTQKRQNILPIVTLVLGLREGISAGNITATTTAQPIPATALVDRKTIMIRNDSGQDAYIGASDVSTAGTDGFLFKNGEVLCLDLDEVTPLYVVLAGGTGAIYYVEGS